MEHPGLHAPAVQPVAAPVGRSPEAAAGLDAVEAAHLFHNLIQPPGLYPLLHYINRLLHHLPRTPFRFLFHYTTPPGQFHPLAQKSILHKSKAPEAVPRRLGKER